MYQLKTSTSEQTDLVMVQQQSFLETRCREMSLSSLAHNLEQICRVTIVTPSLAGRLLYSIFCMPLSGLNAIKNFATLSPSPLRGLVPFVIHYLIQDTPLCQATQSHCLMDEDGFVVLQSSVVCLDAHPS